MGTVSTVSIHSMLRRLAFMVAGLGSLIACLAFDCQDKEQHVESRATADSTTGFIRDDVNLYTLLYVEARTKEGLEGYPYGDLVVLNPRSGASVKLPIDPDYKENPCWSPDGNVILYAATRKGISSRMKQLGPFSPKDLFVHDLQTGESKLWIALNELHGGANPNHFVGLTWSPREDLIYFSGLDNRIYVINKNQETISVLFETEAGSEIDDLSLSPNGTLLAFTSVWIPPLKASIGKSRWSLCVLNIERQTVDTVHTADKALSLGSWTIDGKSIIFTDSVAKKVNYYLRGVEPLGIPTKQNRIFPAQVCQLDDITFAFLRGISKPGDSSEREVATYNVPTAEIRTVTQSQLEKRGLKAKTHKSGSTMLGLH